MHNCANVDLAATATLGFWDQRPWFLWGWLWEFDGCSQGSGR